jgi:hypothetical protein
LFTGQAKDSGRWEIDATSFRFSMDDLSLSLPLSLLLYCLPLATKLWSKQIQQSRSNSVGLVFLAGHGHRTVSFTDLEGKKEPKRREKPSWRFI